MFDIGWSEFVVIGVVALIVIGPKELPAVLRAIGQWTTKIRRMAGEFQSQFQEAMREAEMADLKKQVDELSDAAKGIIRFRSARFQGGDQVGAEDGPTDGSPSRSPRRGRRRNPRRQPALSETHDAGGSPPSPPRRVATGTLVRPRVPPPHCPRRTSDRRPSRILRPLAEGSGRA